MTSIAREQLYGHVSPVTGEHAIMEERFSVRSVAGIYIYKTRTSSHLRVVVVRSEKLVTEARNSSGTQRKGNVRC
jgi:hypothetical protein